MQQWIRRAVSATAAIVVSASVAGAQLIQYSTSGAFSGAICGGAPASCNTGAAMLTYTPIVNAMYLGSNTGADFGTFSLGSAGGSANFGDFSQAAFTLTITQSQPSAGGQVVSGNIGGTIFYDPGTGGSTGGLFWIPTVRTFSIGAVNYEIYVDNNGRFNIASPTGQPGQNPNPSTIRGQVNVVPEPSTVLLLGSGIAGLGLFGLRSRRRQITDAA